MTLHTAPQLHRDDLKPRDQLVTISVSSCYNYAAATMPGGNGCECPGVEGLLPETRTVIGGTTNYGCSLYSTVVTISLAPNPYPYTSIFTNSAVIAVRSHERMPLEPC